MSRQVELTPPRPIDGIRLGTSAAGVRYQGRDDLVVVELANGCRCAAVFTRNAFAAAPVVVARQHLAAGSPRYLLINTGNANAGTGAAGLETALQSCALLADHQQIPVHEVIPFSTGVIGEPLPLEPFVTGIPLALAELREDGWLAAAKAIMTTDTVAKTCSKTVDIAGQTVIVTGIAKGAGMIRPDMATMLAFIATDATISARAVSGMLDVAVKDSFNRITVDGDTSTNDACVLIATGRKQLYPDATSNSECEAVLQAVVTEVCTELALAIVRDGEGATKLVEISVSGGRSRQESESVAYTVAHSPLVKTALFASDPNWGRILAAVGRAGLIDLDIDQVLISVNELAVVAGGGRAPDYSEEAGQRAFASDDIRIDIDLQRGAVHASVWTCDLSHEYVRINAEYRT